MKDQSSYQNHKILCWIAFVRLCIKLGHFFFFSFCRSLSATTLSQRSWMSINSHKVYSGTFRAHLFIVLIFWRQTLPKIFKGRDWCWNLMRILELTAWRRNFSSYQFFTTINDKSVIPLEAHVVGVVIRTAATDLTSIPDSHYVYPGQVNTITRWHMKVLYNATRNLCSTYFAFQEQLLTEHGYNKTSLSA